MRGKGFRPSKARLGADPSCLRASPTSNQRASFKRGSKSNSRSPLGVPKSHGLVEPWRLALAFSASLHVLLAIEAASPRSRPGRWRKPSRPFREGGYAFASVGIGRLMRFRKSPARASRGLPRQHDRAQIMGQTRKCEEFGRSQVLLECGLQSALSLRRTARVVTGLVKML
jgi:hypothetical protein